jgi:hypothetical protein
MAPAVVPPPVKKAVLALAFAGCVQARQGRLEVNS